METTSTLLSSLCDHLRNLMYHAQAIEGPPPPQPLPAIEGPPPQAKPAWRVVQKKQERKARTVPKIAAAPQPMPPPPPLEPVREVPSWAQWRRVYILTPYV